MLAFEFLTDRLPYDATNATTMMLQRINSEPLDAAVDQAEIVTGDLRYPPSVDRPPQRSALADHENASRSPAERSRQARSDRDRDDAGSRTDAGLTRFASPGSLADAGRGRKRSVPARNRCCASINERTGAS